MIKGGCEETGGVFRPLVGVSAWIKQIQADVEAYAPFTSSVLITGPSGTGKELIARSIHAKSSRASAPFIPVNCAAISGTLFESHMFGHLKGAFTGSNYEALGCFRAAEGGTIFLDEIGELEPAMQAKLLRVLQEDAVVPVGSHEEQRIDVRVLAATNRDIAADVAAGQFREDLYYRLAVVSLRTIPLSERPEDIELLADYLLSSLCVKHGLPFKPLSQDALEKLCRHNWPGNVRELQNVLERSTMLARGNLIEATDIVFDTVGLPSKQPTVHQEPPTETAPWQFPEASNGRWPTYEDCEQEIIARTLRHTNFNQAAAARLLNIDRTVLRRRMKKRGIDASGSVSVGTSDYPTNDR